MRIDPTILFLLFSLSGFSQNVKVTGTVKDSLGIPLEMANVIVVNSLDGTMENYAITDHSGQFQLSLEVGKTYILRASFVGLRTAEKEVLPSASGENTVDFTLLEDENKLDDVELVYEMPVIKRGDTLIYNADSFTNGTERKLGDILKKMPGIEVNDSGEIQVDGKKVSKVMVDGKDFFDGDSKLATKNIPADAVSKVEVLRNYNEVNQMRGLGNDQDNTAINLKLKEGKENFWFGDLEGNFGEGEGIRYAADSRLFYYSPNTSINLIANSNNVGNVPFTFNDYFNFTGGFKNYGGAGTSLNISDSDLGFLTMQNDRANELRSHFGAANFSQKLSGKWDISGFSLFSDNYTGFINETLRQYIETGANEFNRSESEQQNRLGMAKISSIYKPNLNFQLDYDLLVKGSLQQETTDAVSVFSEGNIVNPIFQQKENDPFSLRQNLNAYYTLNERNVFAGYLTHFLSNENPFYRAVVGLFPFENILPLYQVSGNFDLNQNRKSQSSRTDAKIDYFFVINNKSNINLTIGTTSSNQNFTSSLFQNLNSSESILLDDQEFLNDVDYKFTDHFFGIKYKLKEGIFTFTPGLSLHQYNAQNEQNGRATEINRTLLLPSFLAYVQFRQSESLRFNYQMTADFTDVNNLAEAYVFTNYNRLFRGNRNLENAIYHSLGLNYINFNMFNFTNIFGNINYSKRINSIIGSNLVDQINLVATRVNSNLPEEIWRANGSFEKTFRKIKTKLNTNLLYSNYNVIANLQSQRSRNFTQNYQGSLLTNFKKSPHFEIGYNRSINYYDLGGLKNIFNTDRFFANVEVIFAAGFHFVADWSYFNYSNAENTLENQYSFIEAALRYQKPGSSWEFGIDGENLLNVKSLNRDNFNENFSSTSEYFVLPRIIMASLKYNL